MDLKRIQPHRINNILHSGIMLAGMTLSSGFLGWMIAGFKEIVRAAMIGVVVLLLTPGISPKATLRLYGARPPGSVKVAALLRSWLQGGGL
ncbi:MAG: hypothetical protein KKB20_23275 [Proteobacteria bacterium]|nr:hypothetical protein [Pseudomonadota bacterium]